MEFYSNGRGKVLFSGYSHFITDEKGVYRGNMLVSNEEVEQWILRHIPLEAFVCIREYLQKVIEGIYGRYYSGPMGIDMMICPDQRGYSYAIYPHVEINVRMTMGMVARQLYDNFVAPGSKGIFNVDNFPSAEALRTQHEQDMRDYPLIVEEGRIVSTSHLRFMLPPIVSTIPSIRNPMIALTMIIAAFFTYISFPGFLSSHRFTGI